MREKSDAYFMELALKEARKSLLAGGIPVGAVVVAGDEVIAFGRRHLHDDAYLDHAEIRALRAAYRRIGGAGKNITVYTTLEPCVMCFGAMLHGQIKKLVYALEDPFGGATGMKPSMLPPRNKKQYPKIKKGILRAESMKLFRNFLKKTNNPFWRNKKNPLVRIMAKGDRRQSPL